MAAGKFAVAAAAAAIAVIFGLNLLPTHFLAPPVIPGSRGDLHAARVLPVGNAFGPESLAFDPQGGGPYVSVADGRVLKWEGKGGWVDFAVASSSVR
ncbi:hypothetical protein MLD38_007608 [Melastoma candidum]|nr:hypothetical protein MLD38_007608 [Melastoma candidum]